jgi:hypothetical protein
VVTNPVTNFVRHNHSKQLNVFFLQCTTCNEKMNDDKTELIVFCAKQNMPMDLKIKIGDSVIKPTNLVKNLGIKMDYQLNMESQVNHIVLKSTYMNLRNIGRIRKFLTGSATKSLVHAYILSKIDYGNSLLVGIPNKLISKLERLQNTAARVITKTKRCEHITPILKQLHWLPVKRRIEFKILVLTYKCVAGIAPGYLCELIKVREPVMSLRPTFRLEVPKTCLRSYGDRAFSSAGPRLWNHLPQDIKCAPSIDVFKTRLKTWIFQNEFIHIY